ncbi:MAG: plasmid recombination protein [Polaromonas sp.]
MTTPHAAAVPSATAYAVLRVDRRKATTMAAIAAASGHQLRTKPTPNADPTAPPPIVMFLADGKTPYQAARHLLEGAERRNRETVLCREIVLSASPSYFRPGREHLGGVYEPERLKAWASAALAWAKRTWPDQLASMVLHADDEQTPHAHLMVVPRVQKQGGGWRLNSKALFDRERLRELQTSFADAIAHLGIKRGEPGSKAKHSEVRQFYGAIQQVNGMPQRAVIPPAPKPPTRPEGIAGGVSAMGSALGIETAYQKELKIHEAAMKAWRETVRSLRQGEAKSWERMRALAAVAPIRQRSQRPSAAPPNPAASPTVHPNPARPRPR